MSSRSHLSDAVPRCSEHEAAIEAVSRAEHEEALALLGRASESQPEDMRIAIDRAKLLLQLGRLDEAETALQALPAAAQDEGDIGVLRAHVGFLRVADGAPSPEALAAHLEQAPEDSRARHRLAAQLLFRDDYAGALDQLLELVRRDREFDDGAGRRGMLAIFHVLGPAHPLVAQYREPLNDALR
ncbi:MAG TPA: tetratricopeptide repeat protein [Gammaproteobacteria bacterium]|nr:tetratricopeptide repeat protein [Gammaproteobacteria bacterium]